MSRFFKSIVASVTAFSLVCSAGVFKPAFGADTTATVQYDMAQGMAYVDCTSANGITAAAANDGSGMWSFGYTENNTFHYYPELQRRLWDVAVGKVDAWGADVQVVNNRTVLNPFTKGAIGYGFGTNYEWNTLPLSGIQPTAVWKAQYPGTVTATLKLGQPLTTDASADGVRYCVEQVSGSTTTTVSPWADVPRSDTAQTVTFSATVLAGDQLVLHFDSKNNDTEDRMTLFSYQLSQTVNEADLEDGFRVDDLAPLAPPVDDTQKAAYNLDDHFAVRNLFTGFSEYYVDTQYNYRGNRERINGAHTGMYTGLFPAIANDANSRFEIGYYGIGSASNIFTHFNRLSQSSVYTVAPNDPYGEGFVHSLSYGMRVLESTTDLPGYPVDLVQPAALGTAFGQEEAFIGNSYPGENVRATIRFNAPRSGVLSLRLGMRAPASEQSDGILYKITRLYEGNRSRVLTNGYHKAADLSENWTLLSADTSEKLVQENLASIVIKQGEVLELTFDKNVTATEDFFDLVYYSIRYTDGEEDKQVYDMGEGLAVLDTFTGDNSATTTEYQSLTPAYVNSDSSESPWRYGYFTPQGKFCAASVLTRPWFTTTRAPEDSTRTHAPSLSYGYASRLQQYATSYGWDIRNTGVGYVGYDFGNKLITGSNSFPGYGSLGRGAVRFVAPKKGTVVPSVSFYDSSVLGTSEDGVLFKLYKKTVDGSIVSVYPQADETTYTGSDRTTGWALIPGEGAEAVWDDAKVGVNAGDELVMIFDQNGGISGDEFSIVSYTVTYQEQEQFEFDLGEAFAVSNTFADGKDGAFYNYRDGLTPVTPNGAGNWHLGYFNWNTEAFTPFTYLNRENFTTTRAPEDINNYFNGKPQLIWTTQATINTYKPDVYVPAEETATGNTQAHVGPPAAIGYNFSSGDVGNNSFSGDMVNAQAGIRFTVPFAGIIQPTLSLACTLANGGVLYQVYKVEKVTGEKTYLYPQPGEQTYTAYHANTSNWCLLPELTTTLLTRNEAKIGVSAGDELVFRFDKYTSTSNNKHFAIDTLKINYVEDYYGAPIETYPAETVVTYDEENPTLDLRCAKTSDQVLGTVAYTVTDDLLGVLRPTATPGIYELTGVLNDLDDTSRSAVTVTASYYAPDNQTTPKYETSTQLYVRSACRDVLPFTEDPVKTTNLGLAFETFMLPYYTDAVERAQYGIVDLGLAEAWEGATVSFDIQGELEYLGDGRIRALDTYTFVQAGGQQSPDTTVQKVLPQAVVSARRDSNTVGTPIEMTVTAPDGSTAKYHVLIFKTQVQDLAANGANVYTMLGSSKSEQTNAVMYYETYDQNGVFTPMVRSTEKDNNLTYIAKFTAEDRFTMKDYGGGIIHPWGSWTFPNTLESYVNEYQGTYAGQVGFGQTLVAPKSGTLTMTNFLPGNLHSWLSKHITDQKSGTVAVRLYDENDTLLKTLYKESWGPVKDTDGNYGVDTNNNGTLDQNEYYPWEFRGDAEYDVLSGDKNTGITFNVSEGQKVRLMLEIPPNYGSPGHISLSTGQTPNPIYTYSETVGSLQKTEASVGTYRYTATAEIAPTTGSMHYVVTGFDADGKFVGVSSGGKLDQGSTTVQVALHAPDGVNFLKVFFWEDLMNIRPLNSGLIIR